MDEMCSAFWNGQCGYFNEDLDMDEQPSGCDEDGMCSDEYDNGCDEYDVDEDICDECGNPIGFCAPDCSEREIE